MTQLQLQELQLLRKLLAEAIGRMRNDSGDLGDDPMAPFAFDADWEAWALDVDAALAGKEPPAHRRYCGASTPVYYRVACVFMPDHRRMYGARRLRGHWGVVDCEDIVEGCHHLVPPLRRQDQLLFITSARPYQRRSLINPARTVLEYLACVRRTTQ